MTDALRAAAQAALYPLDLAQALLEKSQHHAKIVTAYNDLRAALEAPAERDPTLKAIRDVMARYGWQSRECCEEIAALFELRKVQAEPSTKFRHVKTGGVYEVVALARMEIDQSFVIVYCNVNGGTPWVRPAGEFFDGRFEVERDSAPAAAHPAFDGD